MTVTYEFHYFDVHGRGLIPRMILALGGLNWKDKFVKDWKTEKINTPLMHLPVLTEFQEDGSKFELAECQVIYRYLGRKIGIMGQNDHEMALVEQFCSSWEELYEGYFPLVDSWKHLLSSEQYEKSLHKQLYEVIKPIAMKHEEALAKNNTGFYVGNKMTLADIHAAVSMPLLNHGDELFTKEEMPNLFALHDKVMTNRALKSELDRYPLKN